MKKLVFILLLLTALALLNAQYYTESFEGTWAGTPAAPPSWTQVQTAAGSGSGSDIAWEKSVVSGTTWTPSGNGTKPASAVAGTAVAHYNDYNAKAGQIDRLISPVINLSATTNPRIRFGYFYNAGTAVLKVYATNNAGASWTDISGAIAATGANWITKSFSVPAAFRVANAQFALEVTAAWGSHDLWVDNLVFDEIPVPMAGTYTIDTTLPTAGTNFQTFTEAINKINDSGISASVTFNVKDGSVFVEEVPTLTATGTSTNTITFQRDNTGATRPVIKPTTSLYGIQINGGDYITFNGIDITINSGSTVNYGYGLLAATATNGAQYNTIRNSKITLNKNNTSTKGIYQYYNITPTSALGANSFNTYQNIEVNNCAAGIYVNGTSSSYPDLGTVIGTFGGGSTILGGAAADDMGGATSGYGIYASYQSGMTIGNVEIRNITVTSYYNAYGIYTSSLLGNNVIYNNKIHDIKLAYTSSVYPVYGMYLGMYSTGANQTKAYNNVIWGLSNTYSGSASTSYGVYGIYNTGTGSSTSEYDIDFNSVYINGPVLAVNANYYLSSATGAKVFTRNNVFANYTGAQTGSTKHYCWVSPTVGLVGLAGSVSNNNVMYIDTAANGYVGRAAAVDYAVLPLWTAAMAADGNSRPTNPQFVSATNLHIQTGIATPVEGKGAFGTNNWTTYDMDGDVRNATTPDIGADEGNFVLEAVCVTPTAQPTSLVLTPYQTVINGTFTASSPAADNYLVVRSLTSPVDALPVDGTYYAAGSALGTNGTVVSFNGTSFSATGLTVGTMYYFTVYAVNINGVGGPKYLTTSPLTGSLATMPVAPAVPAAFTASSVSSTQINLAATANATASNVLVVWNSANTFGTPLPGTMYTTGTPLVGGGTVLYAGPVTGLPNHTGLTDCTTYYYAAFSYDVVGSFRNYSTIVTATATTFAIEQPLPYVQGFETTPAPGTPTFPYGWTQVGTGKWAPRNTADTYNRAPHSGFGYTTCQYSSSASDMLISPPVALTAGQSYDYNSYFNTDGLAGYTSFKIYVGTTPTVAGLSTQIAGMTWNPASAQAPTTYTNLTGSFIAPTTGLYFFGFQTVVNSGPWYLDLDDFSVAMTPPIALPVTDPVPAPLAVNQDLNVNLAWVVHGSTSYVDVYFGTDQTLVTNADASVRVAFEQTTPLNSFDLPNLAYNTTYYWQVIPKNSVHTAGVGTVWSFTTKPDPTIYSFPYSEHFTAWPPLNWDLTGGTRNVVSYTGTTPVTWAYANLWGWQVPNNALMKTPPMVLTETGTLGFKWSHSYNATYPLDQMIVEISNDGTNWSELWNKAGTEFNSNDGAGNTNPGTGVWAYVPINSTYVGVPCWVRFNFVSGYGPDAYLDEVKVVYGDYIDFAVTNLALVSSEYKYVGTPVDFTVNVQNTSSSSRAVDVNFYEGSNLLGTVNSGVLAVGATTPVTFQYTFDTAGAYTITASIAEDAELTNNVATLANLDVFTVGQLAEGFEGAIFPPVRWAQWGTPAFVQGVALNAYDGAHVAKLIVTDVAQNLSNLATPRLDVVTGDTFTFYAKASVADMQIQMKASDSPDSTGLWTNIGTPITLTTTYAQYSVDITSLEGTVASLAFNVLPNAVTGNVFIDKVVGPMVFVPAEAPGLVTMLAPATNSTNIDPVTVTLDWDLPQTGGIPTGYTVAISNDPEDMFGQYQQDVLAPATQFTPYLCVENPLLLDYNMDWYWTIYPFNETGTPAPEDCVVWSFRTKQQMNIDATPVDLGEMYIGTSQTVVVPVQNVGPTDMEVMVSPGIGFGMVEYNPVTIPANSTTDLHFNFTAPTVSGTYNSSITITETMPGSSTATINYSVIASTAVVVGNGTLISQSIPVEPYYTYTYSQSIYLQSEINKNNQRITELSYYYNGGTAWSEPGIKIYLGHTALTSFASQDDWQPVSAMTLVYDGPYSVPTTPGWITFQLNSPFNYNNTDNLIIAVNEYAGPTSTYHSGSDEFRCTATAEDRSIFIYEDTPAAFDETLVPFAPPTGSYPTKGINASIPNTKFLLEDIPTTPVFEVAPTAFDFGVVSTSIAATQTFTITNTGIGNLTINNIDITGDAAFTLQSLPTLPVSIAANATATFDVAFAPTTTDVVNATIEITDNLARRAVHSVTVTGSGNSIPAFSIAPTAYDFGAVSSLAPATQTFTVTNTDGGYLNINNITIAGDAEFTLQNLPTFPVAIPTNGTATFDVVFAPTTAGSLTATISVIDDLARGLTSNRARSRATHDVVVNGVGVIPEVLPYSQNFDGTAPSIDIAPADAWVLGTPAKAQIMAAHTAPNAMITRSLTDIYQSNENSSFTLPMISLVGVTHGVQISFWHNFKTEAGWDGCVVEYSIDNGANWLKADANVGTGINYNTSLSSNWYNSTSSSGPIAPPKFSNNSYAYDGAVDGWIQSTTMLPYADIASASVLNVRFHFGSDGSGEDEGWAVDDVVVEEVLWDTIAPTIVTRPLLSTPITDADYVVNATVTDDTSWNSGISSVVLNYSVNGGSELQVPMTLVSGNDYSANIPPQVLGTTVSYYITAVDASTHHNSGNSINVTFNVETPTMLQYDSGSPSIWLGYSTVGSVFGVGTAFANPYGAGNTIKVNSITGGLYNVGTATVHVYDDMMNDLVTPFVHDFTNAGVVETIDLSAMNVIVSTGQFLVTYEGIVGANFFPLDETTPFFPLTHFLIDGGTLYPLESDPAYNGSWLLRAQVEQYIAFLEAPAVTFGWNALGTAPELTWAVITGAGSYNVYGSNDPYAADGSWTLVAANIAATSYEVAGVDYYMFYRVTASSDASVARNLTRSARASHTALTHSNSGISRHIVKMQNNAVAAPKIIKSNRSTRK